MTRGVVVRALDAVNRAYPWSHNDHHLPWVLRQVPPWAARALDVGCGTGTLLRALREVVPAVDGIERDPAAAALAGVEVGDLLDLPPVPRYDLVTAVAVLHHGPPAPALRALRAVLRPGGRLVVVGCHRSTTLADHAVDLLAVAANPLVGVLRRRHAAAARVAMSAPTAEPAESLPEIRAVLATELPGARVHRRLFWRYTAVWDHPAPR